MGTTEVDVIRTIFEAQFTGRQTVRAVVQELDLARQATDALSKALAGSSGSGKLASSTKEAAANLSLFQKGLDANAWKRYTEAVKGHVAAVDEGAISLEKAKASLDKWAWALGNSASVSEEMKKQLLNQIDVIRMQGEAYDNVGQQMGKAVSSLALVPPALTVAGAAAATAAVGVGVLTAALIKLYPVAKEGANMAQLGASFDALNRNVMGTPNLLRDMSMAADGTITRLSTMEGFLTLTAGASESATRRFARAAPELMEIAKAANKLNPMLGDTNFMFNSLARGVKRSEVRLLDNLGLNIKVAEANKTYAEQIGKTVLQLTAEDKQMALLNETLRVGRNLIDQVGGSTEALGDRFNRLTSSWENFVNSWKMNIGAHFLTGAFPTDFLDKMSETAELGAKIEFARQQGIDVGYKNNPYWTGDKRLEELRKANDALERELKRREDIEKRYRIGINAMLKENEERWFAEGGGRDQYQRGFARKDPRTDATISSEMLAPPPWQALFGRDPGQLEKYISDAEDAKKATLDLIMAQREAAEAQREMKQDYWVSVGEMQVKVTEANAAAMDRYNEAISRTGSLMRSLSGEDGFYTTSIENIGTAWVTVGGRTEEQNKVLGELKDAYEDANDELRDYRIGLRGYGEDSEKVGEKMAKLAGEAEFLKGKMDELGSITGTLAQTNIAAVWDFEKIGKYLLDSADAAGIGAVNYASLAMALGDWDSAQAEAALKQSAAGMLTDSFLAELRDTPFLTPAEVQSKWEQLQKEIEGKGGLAIDIILNPPSLEDPKSINDRSSIISNENAGYLSREGIFTAFEEEADRTGEKARQNIIDKLFGTEIPEEVEVTVGLDNIDEVDQMLTDWINEERNVLINIIPVDPAGILGEMSSGRPSRHGDSPVGTGRATGGPVSRGFDYIVGENGPERFTAPADGYISKGTGDGGMVNVFVFNNRDAAAIGMAQAGVSRRLRMDRRMGVSR